MVELKELIERERKKDNFIIDGTDGEYTAIYFTGDVFANNNPRLENYYFDFYKMRIKKASKHILIRDVKQVEYSCGISDELDSVEKVLEFLKEQTKGSKVITIGVSTGGYAATLFGIMLNAEYVLTISGVFTDELVNMVKDTNVPIFYICPRRSEFDLQHYDLIKDIEKINVLSTKSHCHHMPIFKDILNIIINSDIKRLKQMFVYKEKPISERIFIIKYFGIFKFLKRMIKKNIELAK